MDLNQLVHAGEILENLERIENEIQFNSKVLSKAGNIKIDEIIKECCNALSTTCECGNKGRKEFERINAMILEKCLNIKAVVEAKPRLSELLA